MAFTAFTFVHELCHPGALRVHRLVLCPLSFFPFPPIFIAFLATSFMMTFIAFAAFFFACIAFVAFIAGFATLAIFAAGQGTAMGQGTGATQIAESGPLLFEQPVHYITLHYITLHYFTLHYITSHHIIGSLKKRRVFLGGSVLRVCVLGASYVCIP